MVRPLECYDRAAKMRALRDDGWCAFEEAFDRAERLRFEALLRDFVDGLDPTRLQGFGATIFALAAREPRMREFYEQVPVLRFLEAALESPFGFKRTGARISGRASHERIVWHHHHGWGAAEIRQRKRFERLLFICYLEGTDREYGALVVKPRAFSDPFEDAPASRFDPLPDEVALVYPPGTVVVMDGPVLHSALRGTGGELRMICGAHVQSKDVARAHPEDDPPIQRARSFLRHGTFRWGLRDGRKWAEAANRAPLPDSSAY
jgi:hypothetical protein